MPHDSSRAKAPRYSWFLANKKADTEEDLERWASAGLRLLLSDPSSDGFNVQVTTGKADWVARFEAECGGSWDRWSASITDDELLDGPRYHGILVPLPVDRPPYVGKPTHEMIVKALLRGPEPMYVYVLDLDADGSAIGLREVRGCYKLTNPNGKSSFINYGRLDIEGGAQ